MENGSRGVYEAGEDQEKSSVLLKHTSEASVERRDWA